MRVAVACDHAGFPLKAEIMQTVVQAGHEVVDLGAFQVEPLDDYPDYAVKVGQAILAVKLNGVYCCAVPG